EKMFPKSYAGGRDHWGMEGMGNRKNRGRETPLSRYGDELLDMRAVSGDHGLLGAVNAGYHQRTTFHHLLDVISSGFDTCHFAVGRSDISHSTPSRRRNPDSSLFVYCTGPMESCNLTNAVTDCQIPMDFALSQQSQGSDRGSDYGRLCQLSCRRARGRGKIDARVDLLYEREAPGKRSAFWIDRGSLSGKQKSDGSLWPTADEYSFT